MHVRSRCVLLFVLLFSAVTASSQDAPPELTLSINEPSPVAGSVVVLQAVAADALVQRAMGAPLLIWLERLQDRESGAPVDPETEGAAWVPTSGGAQLMTNGMFAFSIDTANYQAGPYAFRVAGGLPTEQTRSEIVVMTVVAE